MERMELPLGLGMALARHEGAMTRFAALSEAERAAVIEKCHSVGSKREIERLVQSL
ncbi:MAG: hypothetical protein Q4F17_11085 [Eubacteriales bacterium]|nr:hypothetical protein [Eubacteriales bacterium]